MAEQTKQQQQSQDLMYLPKDFWSPRYDSTFYSVKVEGFELHLTSPTVSTDTAIALIPGKSIFPAYYYKVVVYRKHKRKTVLRRYSQFRWLCRQLLAHPASPPDKPSYNNINNDAPLAMARPIRLPTSSSGCCDFSWRQDDVFATNRMENLNDFLNGVLIRPGYAMHPAVVAFLELTLS